MSSETVSITTRCPCGAELDTYGEGPWRAEDARKALAAWLEAHAGHRTERAPDTHEHSPDELDRAAAVYGLLEGAIDNLDDDHLIDSDVARIRSRLIEARDRVAETFENTPLEDAIEAAGAAWLEADRVAPSVSAADAILARTHERDVAIGELATLRYRTGKAAGLLGRAHTATLHAIDDLGELRTLGTIRDKLEAAATLLEDATPLTEDDLVAVFGIPADELAAIADAVRDADLVGTSYGDLITDLTDLRAEGRDLLTSLADLRARGAHVATLLGQAEDRLLVYGADDPEEPDLLDALTKVRSARRALLVGFDRSEVDDG